MKFNFVIPPIKHMKLAETEFKAVYALAHLCLKEYNEYYNDYLSYFKKKSEEGYHVILDNGAAENTLINSDVLVKLIKIIKPTEVISPDVLYNKDSTLKELEEFKTKTKNLNIKIFGCPQGNNLQEYLECYKTMIEDERVSVIGLSKLTVPHVLRPLINTNDISKTRQTMIDLLLSLNLLTKPIHLLGMRNPNEFKKYDNVKYNNIRSTDSCYTILSAKDNTLFENIKEDSKIEDGTPDSYFFEELDNLTIQRAKKNIEWMISTIKETQK